MYRIKVFKCYTRSPQTAMLVIDSAAPLCGTFNTAAEAVSAAFTLCEQCGVEFRDCEVEPVGTEGSDG